MGIFSSLLPKHLYVETALRLFALGILFLRLTEYQLFRRDNFINILNQHLTPK